MTLPFIKNCFRLQTQSNKLLSLFLTQAMIDYRTYRRLITHNSVSPMISELPKIHKPLPLRLIVSNINASSYKLDKYVTHILVF